jgi:cytochrome c oxidase subunit 3
MSAVTPAGSQPYYFVPAPSRHPASTAFGLLLIIFGASQWVNGASWGRWVLLTGFLVLVFVLQKWFRDAISESEGGLYGKRIDFSFRWSMSWFIFSEVMFFGAFFGALYWVRAHSVPDLGSLDNAVLWPDFKAVWPSVAPATGCRPGSSSRSRWGRGRSRPQHCDPFPGRHRDDRPPCPDREPSRAGGRLHVVDVLLGLAYLCFQAYEYGHAYSQLTLKLSSGVYGSTFFMLTGFHGFHVFVGMTMLLFITIRIMRGHFTPERHFGFEGAAWYWHFVDVVWLGLYTVVYWL